MWCSMSSARPLVRCQCPDANRKRTARETVARWFPSVVRRCRYAMSDLGTSVWTGRALQAESDDLEVIGLALLYPALERNVCVPGHHGYPRASDLILGKAQRGRSCHQITDATARPFLHLSSFQLADLGGKANYCYRD